VDGGEPAYCVFPSFDERAGPVVSEPSSIAVAFTRQQDALIQTRRGAERRTVPAEEFVLTGLAPVHWLTVQSLSECLEIRLGPEIRAEIAHECSVGSAIDLEDQVRGRDPFLWTTAARLRTAACGGTPLADVERDTLVQGAFRHVYLRYLGGVPRRHGDGALDRMPLERVLAFVDAHLDGELTLTKLAGVAAMSPFHFLRSFRLATGATPGRFVRSRRLERARSLLRSGGDVRPIARRLGFNRLGRFLAAYRQQFGPSLPADHRVPHH